MDDVSKTRDDLTLDVKIAITGIRDSGQESFITSALIELGWQVNFRAISPEVLLLYIEENPSSLVVISDDFMSSENIVGNRVIYIRGKSRPINHLAGRKLESAGELHELIRNEGKVEGRTNFRIPPTSKELILITSAMPGVGSSTFAMNFAQEISLLGHSTLLIDANYSHPYLSQQIDAHRIDQQIVSSKFGFSVTEISSVESLKRVSALTDDFDFIILDYGAICLPREKFGGRRFGDLLMSWALESADHILFLSSQKKEEIKATLQLSRALKECVPNFEETIGINLASVLSRRERSKYSSEVTSEISKPPLLFSWERRAILAMEQARSTLAANSPKSIFRGEISNSLKQILSSQ